MIYDPLLQNLYADDGQFIKKVSCPLSGSREHIAQFQNAFSNLHCSSCDKTVHNIDELEDDELIEMVGEDSQLCVFATANAKQLTILSGVNCSRTNKLSALPVIHTVRGVDAIVAAQALGHYVHVVATKSSSKRGNRLRYLERHRVTGVLRASDCRRTYEGNSEEYDCVKDWHYVRDDQPHAVAAYLIPKHIQPNTLVYLEDVIEEAFLNGSFGTKDRLQSSPANWDGKRMNVLDHCDGDPPIALG